MALKAKQSRRDSDGRQAAIDEATREESARLNLLIPESLHRRLKLQAIAEGRTATLTSVVIQATTEYLEKYADEEIVI